MNIFVKIQKNKKSFLKPNKIKTVLKHFFQTLFDLYFVIVLLLIK